MFQPFPIFRGKPQYVRKQQILFLICTYTFSTMSETQIKDLAKSYDPASIEAKRHPFREQQSYFKAGLEEGKPSFSI